MRFRSFSSATLYPMCVGKLLCPVIYMTRCSGTPRLVGLPEGLVRERGLEPPRPFNHKILSRSRRIASKGLTKNKGTYGYTTRL